MDKPDTQGYRIQLANENTLLLLANTECKQDKITEIARTISGILEWLGVPDGFTVYLWWRDDPRVLDVKEFPNRRNVNGGWAFTNSSEVFVYRAEEYDRVVIHETIHAMGWDWHMDESPLRCWGLQSDSTVSPHLFEAWTELYAEVLWCAWNNVAWSKQRIYQDMQALQIIVRNGDASWKENTNVFAYYILKATLAPHVEFLLVFGNGTTEAERHRVLCSLVEPELTRLRAASKSVEPKRISLRMTTAD